MSKNIKNIPACVMDIDDYELVRKAKDKLGMKWYDYHVKVAKDYLDNKKEPEVHTSGLLQVD